MPELSRIAEFHAALEQQQTPEERAAMLIDWAEIATQRRDSKVMEEAANLLLALDGDSGNTAWRRAALRYLGLVEFFGQRHDAALELYHQAIALCPPDENTTDLGILNHVIGMAYAILHRNQEAFESFHRALSIHEELHDKLRAAHTLTQTSWLHWELSQYALAMDCGQRARADYEELGDENGIAQTCRAIGLTYYRLGELQPALDYLTRSLGLYEQMGKTGEVAGDYHNIGNIHLALGNVERGMEYYNTALAINRRNNYKPWEAINLQGLSQGYERLGELDRAFEFAQMALATVDEKDEKNSRAIMCCQLAVILEKMNDIDHALEYLTKARDLSLETGVRHTAAMTLSSMGSIYANPAYHGYDAARAEEMLLESVESIKSIGAKVNLYETYDNLANLYKTQQRWEEALRYQELFVALRDEVRGEEVREKAELTEQLRQIAEREKEIAIARAAASAELKATTSLLHKVLPESIATRLMGGEEEIADYLPTVSILFADIAGFTPLSADMPAFIVVRFLNFVFREFDRIIRRHGCEKIKTIGDGYMAVAGAPVECADHAERVVAAALEMLQSISLPEEIRSYIPAGTTFGLRIGLHTGSVVAGVIGEERFVYDIYSDAVNTAARMESHGEPHKIHVTAEFVRHLQNRHAMTKNASHGIIFQQRGEIEIKGKGMMKTYFLSAGRQQEA